MIRAQLTLVRVPVLSEQIIDTAPNVSTVFSDLQRILFCRMMFAVIVKLAVNAIGSPSGINATATVTMTTIRSGTLIHDGCFLCRNEPLPDIVSHALYKMKQNL